MYGMEGQKHGSKYKKFADNPNREKIAKRLTDGKVKWGQGQGEKNIINRGDLTEEAKVWFIVWIQFWFLLSMFAQ